MAIEAAGHHGERAMVLDPFGARGLTIAGHVRALPAAPAAGSDGAARTGTRRSIRTLPSRGRCRRRRTPIWAMPKSRGDAWITTRDCRRSIRMPSSWTAASSCASAAARLRGRRYLRDAPRARLHPSFSATYKPYLAALGHLGMNTKPRLVRRRLAGDRTRISPWRASSRLRRSSARTTASTTPRGCAWPACRNAMAEPVHWRCSRGATDLPGGGSGL